MTVFCVTISVPKMVLHGLILIYCVFQHFHVVTSNGINENKSLPEFVPTDDWQTIQPGQVIPKGIHVQHNFETGLMQGKLMGNNTADANSQPAALVNVKHDENPVEENLQATKKLNVVFGGNTKFRSIADLKGVYKKLNKFVKTDSEIMNKLFTDYSISEDEDEKLSLLDDLCDYLHQFDNAVDFTKNGSLTTLARDLTGAPIRLKNAILLCLSAAMQSNTAVKIKMLDDDLLNHISQIWHRDLSSPEEQLDIQLISSYLLAVNSMLHQFPAAQKAFFGPRWDKAIPVGFDLLHRTWNSRLRSCSLPECKKLKLRIVSHLGSLLEEQNQLSKGDEKKLKQYAEIEFIGELRRQGWCHEIINFLIDRDTTGPMLTDHASREKALQVGLHFVSICNPHELFPVENSTSKEQLNSKLADWHKEYAELATAELEEGVEGVFYFSHLKNLLESFQNSLILSLTRESPSHTEL